MFVPFLMWIETNSIRSVLWGFFEDKLIHLLHGAVKCSSLESLEEELYLLQKACTREVVFRSCRFSCAFGVSPREG